MVATDREYDAIMQTDDLTCRELVELVTEYLDDALSPAERARFEQHLVPCTVCPFYVEQLRTTVKLVGRLTEHDLPVAARESLLTAFRTLKRS
jgi:anti-sigma factor RsiW